MADHMKGGDGQALAFFCSDYNINIFSILPRICLATNDSIWLHRIFYFGYPGFHLSA